MPLIRHANLKDLAREAVVLDLGDLHRQSVAIIADAKAHAARIVAEAQAERARLIADAHAVGRAEGVERGLKEGRDAGEKAGREAGLAEQRDALSKLSLAWTAGLDDFLARREKMLAEAKRDVIRLAAAMGRKVTHRAIELNPAAVVDQMSAVLAMIMRPSRLVMRVNPDDRALAGAALPELLKRFEAVQHAELVDDATVSRGSCVARMTDAASESSEGGGTGEIDAQVQTQLARIVATLLPGDQPATESGDA